MNLVWNERDFWHFLEGIRESDWIGKVWLGFSSISFSVPGHYRGPDCRPGKPVGCVSAPKRRKADWPILGFIQIALGPTLLVLGRMGAGVSCDETAHGCWMEGPVVWRILAVEIPG